MYKYIFIFLFFVSICADDIVAQDPQFSQFYAAPLYLNPALAGSAQQARVGANYRNQWPSIDASFVTISAYFDYFFEKYNSGVGFLVSSDKEGLAGLRSTSVGLQYAYQLSLTDWLTFRPGVHASYVIRDLNFDRLTFGDQYDETGLISKTTAESFNTGFQVSYFDLALGGLFYTENLWIGYSVSHITEPNQSFLNENSPLPMKHSVHAGYKFFLDGGGPFKKKYNTLYQREKSLSPVVQFKSQGKFDQLDVGVYFTFEPIIFGLWYRGLPIKRFEDFNNNESAILLVGFATRGLRIGYSFDYTLSDLGISSGGAHEVSISYEFGGSLFNNTRSIPCPRF